jgi:hypothetical protein
MRIACCISTLILIAACGSPRPAQEQQSATASSPAAPATTAPATAAPASRIEFPTAHGPLSVDVEVDATVAVSTAARRVETIGELPERAVVVVDRYPSVPGGLSMCQAGEESFVRVVSLTGEQPRVTFTAKIGSCVQNIELADPGLEWRAETATLRIEWLSNAEGKTDTQELVISSDGRVLTR